MELYEGVLEDDVGGKCDIDEVRLVFKTITRLSVIVHTHPYLQIISATWCIGQSFQDVPSQIGMELYEGVLEDDMGGECDIDEVRLAFNT